MLNDVTIIMLTDSNTKKLGMPKVFYQFKGKPLWSIQYDKLIDVCPNILIVGLDIDSRPTRVESLQLALQQVKTDKVLIVDLDMPLLSSALIEKIINLKDYDLVTAVTYFEEDIFDSHNINYYSSNSLMKIQPVQLITTRLLIDCLMNYNFKKDLKEFSKLIFENTKIIPIFVEANERELIKLNSKEDASLINNILNINHR